MMFDKSKQVPTGLILKILFMKNAILLPFFLLLFVVAIGQQKRTLVGKVSDGKSPIENVNISIIEKDISTVTDGEGKYEVQVETGDKLKFSYTGLKTIFIKVEDVTKILNPIMVPDVTELDEVVVQNSRRMSQKDLEADYAINKNIIRTAFGYLDADRAAGRIRFLNEDEINPITLCILGLLRNQFAGVVVRGNCQQGGSITIRGNRSLNFNGPAIFDVDGQILVDAPIWLDVNLIKRIAILNNFATTTAYGSIGAGGVVVINTISGAPRLENIVDRARLRNNYVSGKVLTKTDLDKNRPTYLKEIAASGNFEAAVAVFEKYQTTYSNSPYFFMDMATYFTKKWNNTDFSDTIIENNSRLFKDNPVLLKALAYYYEEQGRYEKANAVLKEVFILRPNYAQSYLDIANSYRDLNQVKQAAAIYARYDYLVQEGYMEQDSIVFGPLLEREFNNLLVLNRNALVNSTKSAKLYAAQDEFESTRLVFEWNDSEAEFDLQFVNPENQYYTWQHSLMDNPETVYREKDFGYNVSEYLLDGSLPGTWGVNVKYLGNKSLTPTYLKATVYYNYGSSSQRKETKVFKLTLKDVNQELFKVQSVGGIVTE